MKKLLIAASLSVALLSPVVMKAQDHDRDRDHQGQIYDKKHKDYHTWNDHEDKAWGIYLKQQHRDYIAWDRANERQQAAYWDWRHRHSDALLKIDIR